MTRYGLVAMLAGLLGAFPAGAQTYPAKAVRLIVPFPPGGSTDTLARVLGQKLGELWGQQFIIDDRRRLRWGVDGDHDHHREVGANHQGLGGKTRLNPPDRARCGNTR